MSLTCVLSPASVYSGGTIRQFCSSPYYKYASLQELPNDTPQKYTSLNRERA